MAKPIRVHLPTAPLGDLLRWWKSCQIQGLVIGGLAVALLGRPRITRDVDAVIRIDERRWPEFLATGVKHGFRARIPETLAFARQSRILLVRHEQSGIDVDLSLAELPFEDEALARAQTARVGRMVVPVPTPEDLIIMKAVAHRERDLADIAGIVDACPRLDAKRVRRWVSTFANALEMPELLDDVERLLPKPKRSKRQKRKP